MPGFFLLLILFFHNLLIPPDGTMSLRRLSLGGYRKQKRIGVWKTTNATTCQICLTTLIFPAPNDIVPDGEKQNVATEISEEM